ncbi:MAG: hypothetical protein IJ745_03550 [Bacteroidales bacterium]|nr:hypothetical protein [Bacteroidales bacterium]
MKIQWIITIVAAVGISFAAAHAKQSKDDLREKEPNDIYLRFEHVPGVEVSFIEKMQVNDSCAVDATILRATTDEGWKILSKGFHLPAEKEFFPKALPDSTLTIGYLSKTTDPCVSCGDDTICDLVRIKPWVRKVYVFHCQDKRNIPTIK